MDNSDKLVVENILRYLSKTGESQAALAKKAKIGAISLNRIIKGHRGVGPDVERKLAKAMGCSISELYSHPSLSHSEANSRDSLTLEIIRGLPSLDEDEFDSVLTLVREALSRRASKSSKSL